MKNRFTELERRMELLVEGSLARLVGPRLSASLLAGQLAHALEDEASLDDQGRSVAPDIFSVTLNPDDLDALLRLAPDMESGLAAGIAAAARESGLLLPGQPLVSFAADPSLPRGTLAVTAEHRSKGLGATQGMAREQPDGQARIPTGAYLIIDGKRHHPLVSTVINIGRSLDNQIVVDDARVSRSHAQMQARDGRFVLFDLGSGAGTLVNGRRIAQHILRPGDVISLASNRLVYGEDTVGATDPTPASSIGGGAPGRGESDAG
jgi:hypothetical protein